MTNKEQTPPSLSAVRRTVNAVKSFLANPVVGSVDLRVFIPFRTAKLWTAMAAISLAFIWCGYRFGDRYGLLAGFFCAVAANAMVFLYDDWRVAAQFNGNDLEGRDPHGLLRMTREISRKLSLPMPLLREIPSETPFIFSAGLFPSRLKIFVSSALLRKFTPAEIEALMSSELIRFTQGQTRTATAASAFADLWFLVVGTIDAAFLLRFLMGRRFKRWCLGPFTWLSLPFLALFLRIVIRGRRLLTVDRRTSETFGNGRLLAQALIKLDAYSKALPLDVNLAEAALFPVDPLASYEWSQWASVQPKIETRIRALTGHYPL